MKLDKHLWGMIQVYFTWPHCKWLDQGSSPLFQQKMKAQTSPKGSITFLCFFTFSFIYSLFPHGILSSLVMITLLVLFTTFLLYRWVRVLIFIIKKISNQRDRTVCRKLSGLCPESAKAEQTHKGITGKITFSSISLSIFISSFALATCPTFLSKFPPIFETLSHWSFLSRTSACLHEFYLKWLQYGEKGFPMNMTSPCLKSAHKPSS